MIQYDFDTIMNRKATKALKYEGLPDGAISMSVADMDFPLMPEVSKAVQDHLTDSGYIGMTSEDYQAVIDWCKSQFGRSLPKENLLATPGVLYTTRCAMYALTAPGDHVIVQPPLHTPSIASAALLGRIPLQNRLVRNSNGQYSFDLDQLEVYFKQGAKVLMMCAPNNPTGRVWTEEELSEIAGLVQKYDAYVISDEIHRDIVWNGHKHVSIAWLPGMENRTIAAFSTSKTFNMGGFHIGSAEIASPIIREKVKNQLYAFGHACGRPATPCIVAQTAAYRFGRPWHQQMLSYVQENIRLALEMIEDLPIHAVHPEGTFLLWLDISELHFDDFALKRWSEQTNVWFDPGHYYDTADYLNYHGPEDFIRLNLAMPRCQIEEAFLRIRRSFGK